MGRNRTYATLLLLLAPLGCQRDTGDAGVKPVGVGFDPGDLFPRPEPKGGVIDYTYIQFKGQNLDLGATGLYLSTGAFTDPSSDPFEAVLGYGLLFSPAILAADEYQLISPKGPDIEDACYVQVANRGPLGSFRTVDVGDRITISATDAGSPMRVELVRDPQNYPANSSSVSLQYSTALPALIGNPSFPDNWSFDRDLALHFSGGLPPENAPVASIPRPSDAADPNVGKEAGDPTIHAPADLGELRVSNRLDHGDDVVMRYEPGSELPDPQANDRVLSLRWDASPDAGSVVTIALKVLRADEPYLLESGDFCTAAAPVADEDKVGDWQTAYADAKTRWCDPTFEPDLTLGNDETGVDFEGADTCHNDVDEDGDGTCDESGCEGTDGNGDPIWLGPDPDCARHSWTTADCQQGYCVDRGGDRNPEGHLGELVCTATDDGEYVVPAEMIADLIERVGADAIEGAMLTVARVSEVEITVPTVRNLLGNQENINPVRLRASQVQYGRVGWSAAAAE